MTRELDNTKYCQRALALKNDIEGSFLVLGEYLYNIKEKSLWEPFWASWGQFCDEMKMSRTNADRLISIYSTFVLKYGFTPEQLLPAGGALAEIIPVVTTKKEAIHWITEASLLTRADLRKSIHETTKGVDMSTCEHKNTYLVEVCKDCGERQEVIKGKILK